MSNKINNSRIVKSIVQQGKRLVASLFQNSHKEITNGGFNKVIKELNLKIDNLQKEITKLKKQEKSHAPYVKLLLWIVCLSVSFFALFITLNYYLDFGISGDAVVITFIGIAATFVVVSNYLQVKEVKDEFRKSVLILEQKLEQKFNERIIDVESKISSYNFFSYALTNERDNEFIGAFYYYVYAIASWHNALNVDKKMIDTMINGIINLVPKNNFEDFVLQPPKIDGYMLDYCLKALYRKEIENKSKYEIISFINLIKEKAKGKISYDDFFEF